MKKVKIRTLQRIEDSNEHPVFGEDGQVVIDRASGKVKSEHRVDRWGIGEEPVVPEYQALWLAELGVAEILNEVGSDG